MRELENLVSVLNEYIEYYSSQSSQCSYDESYLQGLRDGKLHAYLDVLKTVQMIIKETSHDH